MGAGHQPEDVVADRYRVISTLGVGGVGITYAAEDLQNGTRVALKQLRLWHEQDWKALDLFRREAEVLAQLDHPGIPRYCGHFQVEREGGPAFYLVQELAEGEPLANLALGGWEPGEATARRVAAQLLDILEYLQSRQPAVVHRDIKPANVIRRSDGHVFLVDFGAVRDIFRTTVADGSTIVGTYGYMAPEQFRGHAVPATDLHGLGATLLFLLTRRSPADLPQRRGRPDVRRAAQTSPAFAAWLQRLLEPDPERRYPNATAARRGLEREDRSRRFSVGRLAIMLGAGAIVAVPLVAIAAFALGPLEQGSPDPLSTGVSAASRGAKAPHVRTAESTSGWTEHGKLKYVKLLSGHWSAVFETRFAPDSRHIVTGSNDGTTKLWDVNEGTMVRAFPARCGRVSGLALTADGKTLVTGAADGLVRFWGVESGKQLRSFKAHERGISDIALSSDGRLLGTVTLQGAVAIWDVATGKELQQATQPGRAFSAVFTPDGRELAVAGDDGAIRLFDVQKPGPPRALKGHEGPINEIEISGDGQTLVSAGDDKTVRVWLLANGATMRTIQAHDDEVWTIALHPDGKRLATGSKDGTLRLWDIYSGERLENAFADAHGVIALEFSPDGRKLLSAGGNSAGMVWDLVRPSWRPPVISRPVRIVEPTPDPSWPEERRLVARARYLMDYGKDVQGPRQARSLLEEAIQKNPNHAPAYAELSRAVRALGHIQGNRYRPEAIAEAHRLADRAIELDPDLPLAQTKKAWAYIDGNDPAQARALHAALAKRWPDDIDVISLEVELNRREKKYEELFISARAVVELNPEVNYLKGAYHDLLAVYRHRREWDAVDEVWGSLLNLDPESAWVRGDFAASLLDRGRYDDAIEMAEAARKIMDYPHAQFTQAGAYAGKARAEIRARRLDEADTWLDKAEQLGPHVESVLFTRGLYHHQKNHPALARSFYARALQADPDYEEARQALNQLK